MFPTFANFVTRPPPPLLPGYTLCSVIPDGQKRISWDRSYQDPDYHE